MDDQEIWCYQRPLAFFLLEGCNIRRRKGIKTLRSEVRKILDIPRKVADPAGYAVVARQKRELLQRRLN